MRNTEPMEALLHRAFELAYFILGDRSASIYVAMSALDKLKAALTTQGRRLYYNPTGRSAYPAARTKVNLSEVQLLQRLVYVESELFERLLEGQQRTVSQEDLIIRYVKHLIRITTKHNSFYVTLGLCRLLYNYGTSETSEIYNLVLQDPERMRDDYYYRSRKKRLMQEIRDRFGSLLQTRQGFRGEERFTPQEDSQKYAALVQECLMRFTPWNSFCVLPGEIAPDKNVITELFFEGGDPDKEHQVELNRMHALLHSDCLARLTAALDLDQAERRLELPAFFVSSSGPGPDEDRFNPTELTAGELDAIRRYLDKNSIQRQKFTQGQVSLLIDGKRHAEIELDQSGTFEFDLTDGSELIEIRSIGAVQEDEDTPLAVCLLNYDDRSGILPADFSVTLGKKQQLSLTVLPLTNGGAEASGATLKVAYQEPAPLLSIFATLRQLRNRFDELIDFRPLRNLSVLKAAFTLLLIVSSVIGFWLYFRSGQDTSNPTRVAQLQNDREPAASSNPVATAAPAQASPAEHGERPPQVNGSRRSPTQAVNQGQGIEGLRGTNPKAAALMLLAVKRVYVDQLGSDPFSVQLREKLAGALRASNRFEVVSEREKADAVFRGSVSAGLNPASGPSVVLELVNATGQVTWSLSSAREGKAISNDPAAASATIVKVLLHDVRMIERKNQSRP